MEHDYDIDDRPCPKCGHQYTHTRDCDRCDDGFIDEYEDDPINACPGEFSECHQCRGSGEEHWCPRCGTDLQCLASLKEQDDEDA